MGTSEETVHDLNRLIDIHLDAVDILAYALAGRVSTAVCQTIHAMQDEHAGTAARLQQRVLALSGQPVMAPPRHQYLRPTSPGAEEGIDDPCVLLALRANERVAIESYGMLDTVTEEGLEEYRRGWEMDARHFHLLCAMLRGRGVTAAIGDGSSTMRDTTIELCETLDPGGTTLKINLRVTQTEGGSAPATGTTLREDTP